MDDLVKKTIHFGMGVFDFTKEKVENLVNDMIHRGELTQQEASQTVTEILEKAETEKEAVTEKIKQLVAKAVTEMGMARAAELAALEQRVAALEARLLEVTRRGEPVGTE